jgi:hypothetical protein
VASKKKEDRPWGFFRFAKGLSRLRLACSALPAHLAKDLGRNFVNAAELLGLSERAQAFAEEVRRKRAARGGVAQAAPDWDTAKPVIFLSACTDRERHGGWKYNGGIKLLNNMAKLLRRHGFEAHMVTYDGSYEPWLIDHQPHIGLAEFREKLKAARAVRCVTSWADASGFIDECPALYFWDMELAWTEHPHFRALARLYRTKLRGAAGISRTIQAWHMAHFGRPCVTLPLLIDDAIWFPVESERRPRRVGYMEEGPETAAYVESLRQAARDAGLELEFFLLSGSEAEVLAGMRSCEVFLGLNTGKDPLWGEGCPLSTLESISAGCVLVAFDVLGNREIVEDGFNGLLAPMRRPDLMAARLIGLYKKSGELERLRANADLLRKTSQTMEARWPAVKDFLELTEPL